MQPFQSHLQHPLNHPSSQTTQNIAIAFLLALALAMGAVLLIWRSLQVQAPPPVGTLVISADGQRAVEVMLDGEPVGVAKAGLPLVREVSPGEHEVTVSSAGSPVIREVQVRGAEVKTVHFGNDVTSK